MCGSSTGRGGKHHGKTFYEAVTAEVQGGGQSPSGTAPTPTEVQGMTGSEQSARRIKRMQNGLGATIRTSGRGITGAGPDLISPSLGGKTKIGA